jgi:hypothetical protein
MRKIACFIIVLAMALGLAAGAAAAAKEPAVISQQTLKSWLNDTNLLIIDVRLNSYATSKRKIKGSVRQDPFSVLTWGPATPKDKKIVMY